MRFLADENVPVGVVRFVLYHLEHFSVRLNLSRSLPGLTRQSIFLRKWMDARVKPHGR
jgi:hypothetical protein